MTEIRAANGSDLAAVSALDTELFGLDAWSDTVMAAEFASAGEARQLLVADSDGSLTGYAIMSTLAEVADLQRIGVARESQREGVGSDLVAALDLRALAAGCERMLLEVDANNGSAIAFYVSHGFTEIARRPGYYRSGTDAVVMARDLPCRTAQ